MSTATFQLDRGTPGVLAVRGELGFATASAALAAIDAALAETRAPVLDLAGLTRADSAGLACLLEVLAAAGRRGPKPTLRHLPDGLRALARVCEVETFLD